MTTIRAIALLGFLFASFAAAQPSKLAPDFPGNSENGRVDVIVQFRDVPTEEPRGRIERRGGQLQNDLQSLNAAVYSIPLAAAAAISEDPDVAYVSPDRPVQALLDVTDPAMGAPYALSSGWDGTGIGIAIIDSGVLSSRDLLAANSSAINTSRIVYNQSFVKGASSTWISTATVLMLPVLQQEMLTLPQARAIRNRSGV